MQLIIITERYRDRESPERIQRVATSVPTTTVDAIWCGRENVEALIVRHPVPSMTIPLLTQWIEDVLRAVLITHWGAIPSVGQIPEIVHVLDGDGHDMVTENRINAAMIREHLVHERLEYERKRDEDLERAKLAELMAKYPDAAR